MKSTLTFVKFITLFYLFSYSSLAFCQVLEKVSVFHLGGGSPIYNGGFEVDNFGNTFTSFKVHTDVTYPGGTISGGETKILKHNPQGVLEWGMAIGYNQNGTYDIQVSPTNEIYISGFQNYDFFPDSVNPNGIYNNSSFIAKMDQNGAFLRIIRFPSRPEFSVQENGNIAFVLQVTSNGYLGDQLLDFGSLNPKTLYGELNSAGDVLWYVVNFNQQYSAGNGQSLVRRCMARNGKLYYTGQATGTGMIGSSPITVNGSQTYLAEIDLNSHQIVKAFKTANYKIMDIQVDSQNNIYLAAQTDGGTSATFNGTVYSNTVWKPDSYIFKVNSDFTQHSRYDFFGVTTQNSGIVFVAEIELKNDVLYSIGRISVSSEPMYIGGQAYTNTSKTFVVRHNQDLSFKSAEVISMGDNEVFWQLASNDNRLYMRSKADVYGSILPGTPSGYYEYIGTLKTDLNLISGRAFKDFNMDGIFNGDDRALNGNIVSTTPQALMSVTNPDGFYEFYVDSGQYVVKIENVPNYFTKQPLSTTVNFTGVNQQQNVNLKLIPVPGAHNVSVDFFNLRFVIPGDTAKQQIVVTNTGTFIESGTVKITPLTFSLPLSLITTSPATYQDQQFLSYDFTNFKPGDTIIITVDYPSIPITFLNILGEMSSTSVTVNINSQDIFLSDNVASLASQIISSYDPNLKEVNRKDSINVNDLPEIADFSYTIHFQNEGNAPAKNVLIEDEISDLLLLESLQIVDYSHPMRAEVHGRKIKFFFDSILLPAKSVDEEGSKGFVHFKIKRSLNLALHDSISNHALIYFDYNPAIITNKTVNRIIATNPIAENDDTTTSINVPVMINITANDMDYDGTIDFLSVDLDPLLAGIQTSAVTSEGSWSVNTLGELTYTPLFGFIGNALISYTVKDNSALISNIAVVTITVYGGILPQAVDDIVTTPFFTPVFLNVTANDFDSDGTIDSSTVDLNQISSGIQATVLSTEGEWIVNSIGELTFTPVLGFSGVALITYSVKDNDGQISNLAKVKITVLADESVGIENIDNSGLFKIYPNPASEELTIEVPEGKIFKIRILNILGSVVIDQSPSSKVNISRLSSGIYYIQVIENNNEVRYSTKLVKN